MWNSVILLLPVLLPSWRFFDWIAPSPRIEYALLETEQREAGSWQEFRPRPEHVSVGQMVKRLFWNPRWNETLFLVSCAERLLEQPTEHSIREIQGRMARELRQRPEAARLPYMQFRLVLVSRQDAELHRQVAYISPIYPYGEGRGI